MPKCVTLGLNSVTMSMTKTTQWLNVMACLKLSASGEFRAVSLKRPLRANKLSEAERKKLCSFPKKLTFNRFPGDKREHLELPSMYSQVLAPWS